MTSFILIALFLIQPSASGAENDTLRINESLIAEHTTYFEIRNNNIEGADTLMIALREAHFVTLGELHNRTRLGELTESLLQYLEPHGFNHFAIETGPYSARKLEEMIQAGKPAVSAFYARYSNRLFDIVPIPFFKGESDLSFLDAANTLGYDLWGLDQEFQFSYIFLIDELARLAGDALTAEQKMFRRKLSRRLYWMNRRSQIFSGFQLSCSLQSGDQFKTYLQSFEKSDHPDIRMISDAMQTTLAIYCFAEQGKASEQIRISYFKKNFDRNYEAALVNNTEPKVFLKMGSFHMGRQRSPLNLFDMGNHIHQLAESKGQNSVHIRYLNRFLEGNDMKGRSGWESSEQLISVGDRERWALVDLRQLREQILNGTLRGTDFEVREILNYDFIVISPDDDFVNRHW